MPVVPVRHATGQYDVHIEAGILLSLPELLTAALGRRKLVLITDDIVGRYYDEWTRGTAEARALGARSSDAGIRLRCEARLSFPAGEESKTRETWIRLSDEMLGQGLDRQAGIVALGGGVVGDLAGFVAATFLRGVPYAQVPTTLLAMLDASVGGKVGVDTSLGKNLIGAFHPPAIVVADPLTLLSLPDRVYKAGMAEAVKHGLIADAAYFAWIEANARRLLARDLDALTHLVHRSVEIKAAVVSADEREGGQRAILNAGHTIAHGLELAAHYRLPHGEAVALVLLHVRDHEAEVGRHQAFGRFFIALLGEPGQPLLLGRVGDHGELLDVLQVLIKGTGGHGTKEGLGPAGVRRRHDGSAWRTTRRLSLAGRGLGWPLEKVCEYRTRQKTGQEENSFHITNRLFASRCGVCPPPGQLHGHLPAGRLQVSYCLICC